uniref:Phosphatidylinositol-3-phosphatase SAC1 n=1 Tax=Strongyloides stercoralis TaxID=6248 RepID=A0AAF5DDA8_STRER
MPDFDSDTYERFNLYISPEKFFFEPRDSIGNLVSNTYLEIDRFNNQLLLKDGGYSPIPYQQVEIFSIFGIFGIYPTNQGNLLVIIKKAQIIGFLNGIEIYKILEIDVIPFNKKTPGTIEYLNEKQLIDMIHYVIANGSFYYSNRYDLTRSMKWLVDCSLPDFKSQPMIERSDSRFTWNRYMASSFMGKPDLRKYISPVMQGYVGIRHCTLNFHAFKLILISRRSIHRAGVRFFKRGVDSKGNPANYVETEQIIEYDPYGDPNKKRMTSFLQMRGSIPLFWSQKPNLKWAPIPAVNPTDDQLEAYLTHMWTQYHLYNGKHLLINLVNQKGREKKVGGELERIVRQANLDFVRYVPFDFHKECHGLDWSRLSILKDDVIHDVTSANYSEAIGGKPISSQKTFFRTNCMDCLDRTNVVQSIIALESLFLQLIGHEIVDDISMIKHNEEFMFAFKNIWADNGDECSRQYAGTGALKADFTRIGKRTVNGAINDGINAISRYFRNNFCDGYKQDSIDLFLGNAFPSNDIIPRIVSESSLNVSSFNGAAIIGFVFSLAMTILCILISGNIIRIETTSILLFSNQPKFFFIMENQQQATASELCRAGCGFFGSATTEGLCSKCYKDSIKRKHDNVRLSPSSVPHSGASTSDACSSRNVDHVAEQIREVVSACQSLKSSDITQKSLENVISQTSVVVPHVEKVDLASVQIPSSSVSSKPSIGKSSSDNQPPTDISVTKKTVNRCGMCKKKVGLTGFTCRCGGLYCSTHRYDSAHDCSFDYRTTEREQIAKNNPTIGFNKIERI